MMKLHITELQPNGSYLLPVLLGDSKITSANGIHIFKPGETPHPEPRHAHNVHEVFIFLQGKGVLPVDGVDIPVQAGDVVLVGPGEDHHTRSSVDEPLVAAWYLMDR
jgi:mannose-6-phosphate isomerase-like protein (cupin superfamily)